MDFTVIIPARFQSVRFPGKLLKEINGKTILEHVYQRALSANPTNIIIATDNDEIKNIASSFGADVCMTSDKHQSGTQRLSEVIEIRKINEHEIIVNLQGDEPLMPGSCIRQVAQLLDSSSDAAVATLSEKITNMDELYNPNIAKVVVDKNNYAMYFSRSAIPFERDNSTSIDFDATDFNYFRHVGIYSYRAAYIQRYINMEQSPIENIEKLEQLRVLWHGDKIAVQMACESTGMGVDTAEDFALVSKIMTDS